MFREFYDTQKVRSVDWDRISLEMILTGGSDKSAKIYDLLQEDTEEASLEFSKHDGNIMDAHWSTHAPYTFICMCLHTNSCN